MLKKQTHFLVIALLLVSLLNAQRVKMDSLKQVISVSAVDTAVIDAQVELAAIYRKQNKPDSARLYLVDALSKAQIKKYKRGEARALYQNGVLLAMDGKYVDAMSSFDMASDLAALVGDKKTQASALQGIGNNKSFLGDYKGALDYCLKSIELKRELGDSAGLGTAYGALANLYNLSGQHPAALQYYQAALRSDSATHKSETIATDYYNIANTYHLMDMDTLALKFIEKCLDVAEQTNDGGAAGYALGMKGILINERGNHSEGLIIGLQSLALAEQYQDPLLMASQYVAVGICARAMGNYEMAELYLDSSLRLSVTAGLKERILIAYGELSELYEAMGATDKALANLKRYVQVKDSLNRNSQKDEMMRMEMNYRYEKQKELDKAEQDKNNAIYEEDKKRKTLIIYSGAGFLLLVLFFLGFVFSRYRISQRQKTLIALQKSEVEMQSQEIESKNKDITDSINYASRIQSAILPDVADFRTHFSESFVYYRPKDIVSGDFYWIAETEDHIFYATADCTGHGVPGGFMSMLGMALLNEVVIERKIPEPGRIMDMMRERIISALKQKGVSGENKDGMDMVLCRIDKSKSQLHFAAANNNLWILRDGAIMEYKADKQPVGIGAIENIPFSNHVVPLQAGDIVYTYTDGFADQFGGQKNKKYKYSQLKKYLVAISQDSMKEQGEKLNREFITWKGIMEQVDDVLIIGIRI